MLGFSIKYKHMIVLIKKAQKIVSFLKTIKFNIIMCLKLIEFKEMYFTSTLLYIYNNR